MTVLRTEADSDEGELSGHVYDEEATVRIVGDEEGGADRIGLDAWFNSARLNVDPDQDDVTCVVSIGDPRGYFAFRVYRDSDGKIHVSTPYAGESMPHQELMKVSEGHFVVVEKHNSKTPLIFADEEALNREPGWRDGWQEMEEGFSEPDDSDAVYGIDHSSRGGGCSTPWRVVAIESRKVPKGLDGVADFEDADDAAERAEELNEEALDAEE